MTDPRVPGSRSDAPLAVNDPDWIAGQIPDQVLALLERLWSAGHAAYVVGGSLRDALLGLEPSDWDVTTDARPDRIQRLFPGSHYENRFGTVLVPVESGEIVEVTTFRRDHRYGDHRRPDAVTFGDDLRADLERRDFTVNALAWGRERARGEAGEGAASGATRASDGTQASSATLVDAFGGMEDLRRRLLRAVGDPRRRFDEDALRLVRAARLSAQLEFDIVPGTRAAMDETAGLVRYVSQERIGQELRKLMHAREPSRGLQVMAASGILAAAIPELAAQIGVPQNKVPGMDCWDHTVATVDAARRLAPGDEVLALAALFHDAGKPQTGGNGHFFGHEQAGARIAEAVLRRIAIPHEEVDRVVHLIRHHMFGYEPAWSDAAVRRFVLRVGSDTVDQVLLLREADNLGSGQHADQGHLLEFRRRIAEQEQRGFARSTSDLAVNGFDLQRELGLEPGPAVGMLLGRLLESAIADPSRNTYRQSIVDARGWLPEILERAKTGGDRAAGNERPAGDEPTGDGERTTGEDRATGGGEVDRTSGGGEVDRTTAGGDAERTSAFDGDADRASAFDGGRRDDSPEDEE